LHGLGGLGPYRLAFWSRRYRRTVLRAQPSCRAISRTPSPLRALTRISTACSWVNIDSPKTVSFAQVGHFYFGAVGQLCIGGDTQLRRKARRRVRPLPPLSQEVRMIRIEIDDGRDPRWVYKVVAGRAYRP
jgi:hypothetical protein